MKKQLIAIGLASVLTAPSVALAQEEAAAAEEMAVEEVVTEEVVTEEMAAEEMAAEAPAGPSVTVYGTFRTGLEFESGAGAGDATVTSFYSRFGIKGSSEVSEGLTGSFQIERDFDSATATEAELGRIGRVALSGGFGTLALGHMGTATGTYYYGNVTPLMQYGTAGGATSRQSQMVSYSSSVGAVGFQIDRYTDVDTKAATVEFGASTTAGPVTVGVAYWGKEDAAATAVPLTTTIYKPSLINATNVNTTVASAEVRTTTNSYGTVTTLTQDVVTTKIGGGTITDTDKEVTKFTDADGNELTVTSLDQDGKVKVTNETELNPKTSFSGFFVSSSLAGMNLTLGVGSVDHGIDDVAGTTEVDESQTDVSIVALKGAVGDSGVSYAVWLMNSDKVWKLDMNGKPTTTVVDPSETVIHLTSALGGGVSLVFEHSDKSKSALESDASLIALKVDF